MMYKLVFYEIVIVVLVIKFILLNITSFKLISPDIDLIMSEPLATSVATMLSMVMLVALKVDYCMFTNPSLPPVMLKFSIIVTELARIYNKYFPTPVPAYF